MNDLAPFDDLKLDRTYLAGAMRFASWAMTAEHPGESPADAVADQYDQAVHQPCGGPAVKAAFAAGFFMAAAETYRTLMGEALAQQANGGRREEARVALAANVRNFASAQGEAAWMAAGKLPPLEGGRR